MMIGGDNKGVLTCGLRTCVEFVVVSVIIAIPVVLTVLFSSDFTPYGRSAYSYVYHHPGWQARRNEFAAAAGVLALVGWLMDVHLWNRCRSVGKAWMIATMVVGMGACLWHTPAAPSMPLVVGLLITVLLVLALESARPSVSGTGSEHLCGITLCAAGVLLMVVWSAWAFFGRDGLFLDETTDAQKQLDETAEFILWSSPAILGCCCVLCGSFEILRSQLHVDSKTHRMQVGSTLKFYLIILVVLFGTAWIVSMVAAPDMGLSTTVKRVIIAMLLAFVFFLSKTFGLQELEELADGDYIVGLLRDLLNGDWTRALAVLLAGPALPLYFACEALHRGVQRLGPTDTQGSDSDRANLVDAGAQSAYGSTASNSRGNWEGAFLTRNARHAYSRMRDDWDWHSILGKAIMLGFAYWLVSVCCSMGVNILLAWLNEKAAGLSLWTVLVLLWVIGISLFALPPVPGFPVYLAAGHMIVRVSKDAGIEFYSACGIAVAFSFFIKMTAIVVEQKCIGEAFSRNIAVRKFVGTHSLLTRAFEYILRQKGFCLDKAVVLSFGPDWPVSVISGILRLNVWEMLLGSTPVIVVVAPPVFAAAFSLRAGWDEENGKQWAALAKVLMALTGALMGCGSLTAGYFVQRVIQDEDKCREIMARKDATAEDKALDEQVARAVAADEIWHQTYSREIRWDHTPWWLRVTLAIGTLFMTASIYIILMPASCRSWMGGWMEGPALIELLSTDKLSEVGGIAGLVRPPARVGAVLGLISVCSLLASAVWCSAAAMRVKGMMDAEGNLNGESGVRSQGRAEF